MRSKAGPVRGRGLGRSTSTSQSMIPSLSTTTRSASTIASSTSWVMSSAVNPCSSHSRSSNPCMLIRVSASSAPSGSSSNSNPGRENSARASDTRCFSPPERLPGMSSARSANPTHSNNASASRFAASLLCPNATFSTTRFHAKSR